MGHFATLLCSLSLPLSSFFSVSLKTSTWDRRKIDEIGCNHQITIHWGMFIYELFTFIGCAGFSFVFLSELFLLGQFDSQSINPVEWRKKKLTFIKVPKLRKAGPFTWAPQNQYFTRLPMKVSSSTSAPRNHTRTPLRKCQVTTTISRNRLTAHESTTDLLSFAHEPKLRGPPTDTKALVARHLEVAERSAQWSESKHTTREKSRSVPA